MDNLVPAYRALVQLEDKTLKFLHDVLSQREMFWHGEGQVKKYWSKPHPDCFSFSTYWDVIYRCKGCHVFLGAVIKKRHGGEQVANSTYFMSIVERTNQRKRILRQFHFDYVTERQDRRQAHPRLHLQYCGRFPPAMTELGINDEDMKLLQPDVDGPRIFFRPMTLALLMNIAFYEFPGGEIDEVRKRGEWQNLVRENEKVVLRPFYECCARLAGKEKSIFFDKVYV